MPDAVPRCHFCGSKKILLEGIGISIGFGGSDYAFCEECLRSNSAYKFWYNVYENLGLEFPGPDEDDGWGQRVGRS